MDIHAGTSIYGYLASGSGSSSGFGSCLAPVSIAGYLGPMPDAGYPSLVPAQQPGPPVPAQPSRPMMAPAKTTVAIALA